MSLRLLKSFCTSCALWLVTAFSLAAEFYVSPTGRAGASGSASDPWNLATALSHPPAVRPGDTIWVRGGTYRGEFTSALTGAPSAPIRVRSYPGERATIDGGNSGGRGILNVYGGYTWYWGLEVISSDPNRRSSQSHGDATDVGRGGGVVPHSGAGLKFINMVVHDTRLAFSLFSAATDLELYGSLAYYNGFVSPSAGYGNGLYTQNLPSSSKRYIDNIIFRNFSLGVQAYGSAAASVDNVHFEGNTIFRNGEPAASLSQDLLVGGAHIAQRPVVTGNFLYERADGASSAFHIGYLGQPAR